MAFKDLSKLNFLNYVIPTSNNYLTFEYKIKKFFRDLDYEPDLRHMYWMGSFNYNQKKWLKKTKRIRDQLIIYDFKNLLLKKEISKLK